MTLDDLVHEYTFKEVFEKLKTIKQDCGGEPHFESYLHAWNSLIEITPKPSDLKLVVEQYYCFSEYEDCVDEETCLYNRIKGLDFLKEDGPHQHIGKSYMGVEALEKFNSLTDKEREDDESYYYEDRIDVYGKYDGKDETYGLSFMPWDEWLGGEVVNNAFLDEVSLLAECLWEMTFHGFDNEEVQERANELKAAFDEAKKCYKKLIQDEENE